MGPPLSWDMTVQPGSSQCAPGYPYLAASLHSADRSASTLLLVVIEEWWWGHPPVPVKIPCYITTTTDCIYMYIVHIQECTYIKYTHSPLGSPRWSVRAGEDDTCHLQDRVGCGQTVGMQHTHRHSCHMHRVHVAKILVLHQ